MHALARHRMALALPSAGRLDALLPSKLCRALRERQRSMALRALQHTAAVRGIVDALRG
ncbi:hypothetical protein I4I83_18550, partial [Acidovorax cattleyae]|nr:hypothetical protein [Paracidovorax cattleyae]